MKQFSQKYTIVQLLEDMSEGDEYAASGWPLHVTLADIFAIDWDESTLISRCFETFSKFKSVRATVGDEDWLGEDEQTHVTLLNMNAELFNLHIDIIKFLEQGNVRFNTPEFIEQGFKPHLTVRPNARLRKGRTVAFDVLTVIDMFPNNDPSRRKVLKTIKLAD
ncbi:MAG: 2'-5' RNA ligase family protein [Microcoleus sp.]